MSAARVRALVVGIALAALAGCGGAPAASLPVTGPGDPANQGGTLTIGVTQEPTSFLAANVTDNMSFAAAIDAPVVEGLLWYRSQDETADAHSLADYWRPDLATEVPTLENGDVHTSGCRAVTSHGAATVPAMCVTWKLRSGVLWQDGTPFSAHDVCATMQFYWLRYGAHNPTAVGATSGWDRLIGCTEDSPLQATLSFGSTYGAYLSLGTGVYGVLPARQLDTAFAQNGDLERTEQTVDLRRGSGNPDAYHGTDTLDHLIVGTGPFVLERDDPGHDIVLVRNRRYWDPQRQPHLDRLVFKVVSDVQSQLSQVSAGEVDMGLDFRLAFLPQLEELARSGRIRILTIPDAGAEKIDLNLCDADAGRCGAQAMHSPFTADPRVRHAMLAAIDRAQIVRVIARGQTVIPPDSWISLGEEYIRDPKVPTTAYDPAAANRILDEAGYPFSARCHGGHGRADAAGDCMDLRLVTSSGNESRAQTQIAVQADLERIGIFTELSTVKAARLVGGFSDGGLLSTHAFQMAMYTIVGAADPEIWYGTYVSDQIPSPANQGAGGNLTGEDDPAVDRAFVEGRSAVDLAVRTRAYMRAEELLAADLPELPLYQQVSVMSVSSRLIGVQRQDNAWTFNSADWYCLGARCTA